MEKPIAVGIDLGTTFSCVGVVQNGKVEIIKNNEGERITPSVVGFFDDDDEQETVGEWPKKRMHEQPENVISCAKRLIGRKFDDPNVQKVTKDVPFKIVASENGNAAIQVEIKGETKIYVPEQISARVLFDIKQTVLRYFGKEMNDKVGAVITIPAYFNDSQRQATIDAARIARINVLRLINEPTAAALAYAYKEKWQEGNLLVYDLGGGTFDVSIIEVTDGCCKVRASTGNDHLGGEDFDNLMVQYCIGEFQRIHGDDISNNREAICKLKSECEDAKRFLSKNNCAAISVKKLYGDKDLKCSITLEIFNELCKDLIEKTLELVQKVLKEAKLDKSAINNVVLVGGSTRIQCIKSYLGEFFGSHKLKFDIDPDEAVANGAAILAAHLSKFCDTSIQNIRLLDVIPRSVGLHVHEDKDDKVGCFCIYIPRNTRFPCKVKGTGITLRDYQTRMKFAIYEGEDQLVQNNKLLGIFRLTNITRAPAGVTKVRVTYKVDENGILTVTATEKSNGNSNSLTVLQHKGRLTDEELVQMANEIHTPIMDINLDNV